ncbi:MAG: adenylate/guanylate cyclase domain-containing protein [Anaerolineales bacterium]|nr:adenylate/guanylate cyclase domain-containing protein [Anaerolineales bacterium]
MRGKTNFVKTPGGYVGYQVFGEGARDILFITNWSTNLDVMWEEPSQVRFFDRLASFGRVICFDKRGSGISDPVPLTALPTLEEWMDDAREVLDAVGSKRTVLIGDTEGGPMAILFAATYPQRTESLILVNSYARFLRDADYPIGLPETSSQKLVDSFEDTWGTGRMLQVTAPSMVSDPRFRESFARYQRLSMPPGASTKMYDWVIRLDLRPVLRSIQAPTLVLHRKENDHYRVAFGRYLAEAIPGARFVELAGADCYPFYAGDANLVLDEVEEFLTGARGVHVSDRVLATVLFTDIVGSTDIAARLGDRRWRATIEDHDALVRGRLAEFRGREIHHTGDGFLTLFDGPGRAIRCAMLLSREMPDLGLDIRAGLHTGEVELGESEVSGIAVHIAARVTDAAGAGEILVSRTVRDLVSGSGIQFEDRGEHPLKGVSEPWQLYSVIQ